MKASLILITSAAVLAAAFSLAGAQTLPAGHPVEAPAATTPAGMALPAGHPSLDSLMSAVPTSQPAVLGSLSVQLVSGSAGGAISGGEIVTAELYHNRTLVKRVEARTDAEGKVAFSELPVNPPVQALLSVKHGGVLQQVDTPELNPGQPSQSLQMKVFEATDEQPAWNIAMQHMIMQWAADGSGAQVIEMLSTSSPGDRVWLGSKVGDERVTLTVPLPPEAQDVKLGGSFDEDVSKIADGKLITSSALFPGRSEFRITYTVPAKDGAITLPIVTPAAVDNLIVFVPADGTQVTSSGPLSGGDVVNMGESSNRMFRAQNLPGGATASISVKGIKASLAEDAPAGPSKWTARNVAIGGAFIMVLAGAAMVLFKKPQPKKA
jgi:hypothetical protein